MERFSLREKVLLGSSPRRSFGSPKIQSKSSEMDFNDVFGGPPRRSSMHEWRNSEEEEEDEASSSLTPWSGLNEKPVFGEETLNRRSFPKDDFFDDIFRGDENSISTTPSRHSRDAFFSNPSSRILSPARPLPPQSESFGGGSSLPVLLSLPAKLAKGVDKAFASPTKSNRSKEGASSGPGSPSSLSSSSISSSIVQNRQDLRNDVLPSRGRTTSSRESYLKNEGISKAVKSDEQNSGIKDLSSSVVNSNVNDQFHFSIYKWPSKGIPIEVKLRGGNKIISEGKDNTAWVESKLFIPAVHGIEISSQNQDNTSGIPGLNTMKKDTRSSSKFAEDAHQSEPIISSASRKAGIGIRPDFGASGVVMDIGLPRFTERDITVPKEESLVTESKPSDHVGKDERSSHGKMVKQDGMKEGTVKRVDMSARNADSKKVKKQNEKQNLSNLSEVTVSSSNHSAASSKSKLVGNKVKGKVKEFVKVFNQESPLKHFSRDEATIETTRVKGAVASKLEDRVTSVDETNADNKDKVVNLKNKRISIDTQVVGDQDMRQAETPRNGINKAPQKIHDASPERNSNPTSCSEPIPEVFVSVVDNMDESRYEDLQPYSLAEELPPKHDEHSETAKHVEEIQNSDAKIRKWSNGKQGNIRSLLSTLQYVLWPESGWKPVPLVDIIEGNSVKRAYQKALLCLHPDKLQQKGATPNQKHIAEKVFDMLQEAWEHYNSLGSL